ncbi:hypothetical protein Moror_16118 [Moniliophthora roreri MCA 2997]|uniref:DUF6535 domain-containing protein n=1 Tax=Moniliophthora roreri (strain MCA 2997) TaxID=1381753 RepID=V2YCN8_MONRO|nr:hypothetical protein Moror_16118 [Moniliophthora roreri MCA 2997]
MSSENLNQNTGRGSSSEAGRSSEKPPDPPQIPLPPSPPEPVQGEQASSEAFPKPADGQKAEGKRPTLNESWEKVLKEAARHDEDMVKGWRDDIDTLLVFAGLFSAVVTAFAIESYQWLDEDPADTTVALLTHLISVQVNGSQSISFKPAQFKPDASSIRINVFWFLSLIFSLTSALFGCFASSGYHTNSSAHTNHLRHGWYTWLSSALLRPLLKFPSIDNFLHEKARRFWDHVKSPASDWSSLDIWVVRQFDRYVSPYPSFILKVYELRAFEWAVTMFRDSPIMIPHLQNLLWTIPPSMAVSAVLGRWDKTMWKAVLMEEVEYALGDSNPLPWIPSPTIRHPVLQHPGGINLLFRHQYWAKLAVDPFLRDYIDQLLDSMKDAHLQHSTGLRFVIPFSVVDALWTHEDTVVRTKSLTLLSVFTQSWEPCPEYDEERHYDERWAFMVALADHINRTDRVSELLVSKRGQAFIRFIHKEVITRQLPILDTWLQAIKRAQEIGGLPSNYFAPIPEDGLPMLPELDPVRYSIKTERDSNDEVLDIVTSNRIGDAFGIGPTEGEHARLPHNLGVDDNVNTSPESHGVHPPDNIIPDHESVAGGPTVNQADFAAEDDVHGTHKGNAQRLQKGDSVKDSDPGKQIGTATLGDTSEQGDEIGDTGGDNYSFHSLNRQASDSQEHANSGATHDKT